MHAGACGLQPCRCSAPPPCCSCPAGWYPLTKGVMPSSWTFNMNKPDEFQVNNVRVDARIGSASDAAKDLSNSPDFGGNCLSGSGKVGREAVGKGAEKEREGGGDRAAVVAAAGGAAPCTRRWLTIPAQPSALPRPFHMRRSCARWAGAPKTYRAPTPGVAPHQVSRSVLLWWRCSWWGRAAGLARRRPGF